MHSIDSCLASSHTGCWRVLLWLQHGPQRHKGNRIQLRFSTDVSAGTPRTTPSYRPRRTNSTAFSDAVGLMQRTQPNYSAHDLADINVPVAIVQSEHDEFIKREHAEYLARSIPDAELYPLAWREPFRTAAEARAIQQRNACFSRQSSSLKNENARVMAQPDRGS